MSQSKYNTKKIPIKNKSMPKNFMDIQYSKNDQLIKAQNLVKEIEYFQNSSYKNMYEK